MVLRRPTGDSIAKIFLEAFSGNVIFVWLLLSCSTQDIYCGPKALEICFKEIKSLVIRPENVFAP